MPPHGRRRLSSATIFISLFILFVSTASAASAVLGIDLGTEYIKAALVKPGIPLEIVLTKDSKRKETAAVAFKPSKSGSDSKIFPERAYGGDALALFARFPSDVYPNLKPLLGQQFEKAKVVSEFRDRFPELRVVESRDRGTVGFKSSSFDQTEEPFLVEELLAMELKNIRANAVALAGKGSSIKDAVITVPPFYTAEEKRAVILAAELAGLRVLSLISDGLAIGLNYATSRTFPVVNEGGKPEINMVYDMGAGSATATILKFQGRTVKDVGKFNKTVQEVHVLGVGTQNQLGGDSLNKLILEDMVQKFVETSKMKALGTETKHVKQHGRTMAKMWKECERIRQVLSANTETQASFEGLYYEDVNFRYKITRSEFESLAATYANQVQIPIISALESAKLKLSDIESVILHGGAVRTPFVQKQLEAAVGSTDKIRTNVNSDEAAVFGAAFKAAGISPSFKVKEIRTSDTAGYASGVTWLSDTKEKHQKLFTPTSAIGAEKQVSFKITDDFKFELFQQLPSESGESTNSLITEIQTKNLTASVKQLEDQFGCLTTDINTRFAIRLSPTDRLPEVVKGSVSCEGTEKKGGVVDGMKDLFGFGAKKNEQKPIVDDDDADTKQEEASTGSSPKASETAEPVAADTKENEKANEPKRRLETIFIDFDSKPAGLPQLSAESLERIKERLAAFDSSDRSRIKREETLNTLEAFTYKARDLLEDEGFINSSTSAQRTEIEEKFKDASEWLYGDGADASRETLKKRLDELHSLVDPVQKRKQETSKRPAAIKSLQETLSQVKVMADVVRQQREAALIAEAAASSSSAAAATGSESPTITEDPSSSPTSDDFADLEDDTSSPTSTSSTSTTTTTAIPETPPIPNYSEEDLNKLLSVHDSVQSWLDGALSAQDKLGPSDDPAILTADLATKSKELQQVVTQMLSRQMRTPPKKPKSNNNSKAKPLKAAKGTGNAKKGKGAGGIPNSSVDIDELLKDMPASDREELEKMMRPPQQTTSGGEEKGSGTGTETKTAREEKQTREKGKGKGKGEEIKHEEL
ncbi:MAG: hypothetical protein Q9190_000325 [Brigantiaea leucoxantha]